VTSIGRHFRDFRSGGLLNSRTRARRRLVEGMGGELHGTGVGFRKRGS
jgi:hypothetical protein